MNTIVPTSCIAVAGQNIRQWRKMYRNKINMFGKSWTEHVYEFTPACKPIFTPEKIGDPYEIRIYKNEQGLVIWAVGEGTYSFFCNDLSPEINKFSILDFPGRSHFANQWKETSWLGWKKEWKRSYSDVRFLLSFERTREDFIEKVTEHRVTWILFTSQEVETAVWQAVNKAEAGRGRPSVRGENSYSGPGSLTIEELRALGCRVCHRPPTKKFHKMAPTDHVVENFNWGSRAPKRAEWFRHGAGYSYNGSCGCNSGWVWYD
jgi:hypothetical protein